MLNPTMNKLLLYHGTNPDSAQELFNCKVKVEIGGGEFGRGFYMGTSKRLAKRRAFHKTEQRFGSAQEAMRSNHKNTFAILLDKDKLIVGTKHKLLSREESISLYQRLKKNNACSQYPYLTKYDFIDGVIVGKKRYYDVHQYKFESELSALMLNGKHYKIPVKRGLI